MPELSNVPDGQPLTYGRDDARFVADFGAGALGVGPQTGFRADEFFPVLTPASEPDRGESDQPDVGPTWG